MKILLITDEVWNDKIHGNNILTNWFAGMDITIANIYCSPGMPDNTCCSLYFQVTDAMMAKSLLGRKKAGRAFRYEGQENTKQAAEGEHKRFYSFMKSITTESVRALREWIWLHGKYDEEALLRFISDFKPDLVFSPRYATRKIMKLERLVHQMTDAPFLAFTADDEYTLRQVRISPVYWVRRLLSRRDLKRNTAFYEKYLMFSREQAAFYAKEFGLETECLYKNGDFPKEFTPKEVHQPIRIVYAGKLYCNRWKVLAEIGDVLREINRGQQRMVLDIYTRDQVSDRQKRRLQDGKNIFLKGAAAPEQLKSIYEAADMALHVESRDRKNRLLTRYSFSTKIIDCLASGCAVMAVCWSGQSGYRYLKDEKAAFCADSHEELQEILHKIVEMPVLVQEFQKNAWKCGIMHHEREAQQEHLLELFNEIIERRR